MVSPDQYEKIDFARRFTRYLTDDEGERLIGIAQTTVSLLAAAGVALAWQNAREILGESLNSEPWLATYSASTIGAGIFSFFGFLDGIGKTIHSTQALRSTEKEISEKGFRIRGFLLNRTVLP